MKLFALSVILLTGSFCMAADLSVTSVRGDVSIRPGVDERWIPVRSGQELKVHDSMRTGPGSSAVILLRDGYETQEIAVPGDVILDLADFRTLSKDEMILKLTMERVKASPYEWKNRELGLPNAAVVHGSRPSADEGVADRTAAKLQMNGARVLFDHGFYSTCALRALSLLGRFPSLSESFDHRLMVAESLEYSGLRGEALSEYVALSQSDLSGEQQELVVERIARLKRRS